MDHLSIKLEGLELFVFDLDYTLWPFWVDTHVCPPFSSRGGKVYDCNGRQVKTYPNVSGILEKLHSLGYKIGIASRTSATEEARDLLRLFNWNRFIFYTEIYPGSKVTHFNRIIKQSGYRPEQIIFFDDEHRNIVDLTQKTICSILVKNGVDWQVIQKGIETYLQNKN